MVLQPLPGTMTSMLKLSSGRERLPIQAFLRVFSGTRSYSFVMIASVAEVDEFSVEPVNRKCLL